MKKYLIALTLLIPIITGTIIYLNIPKKVNSPGIPEDYTFVLLENEIVLNANEEYEYTDFIKIKNGELLYNKHFDTSVLGTSKIEIIYSNNDEGKRKAYIDYEVVDTVVPIILGGSSKLVPTGYKGTITDLFLSADNYDSSPKRELIGDYDVNMEGDYNLILKVSDNSGNTLSKEFTLKVRDEIPVYNTEREKIILKDIIDKHKNDNTKIGLDVSKWQGDINFEKIKDSGVEFVIIRAGYQADFNGENVIDPYFHNNIQKLNDLNIPVGVYFHSYATTKTEGYMQAKFVLKAISDYEVVMPVVFDFESWNVFSSLNLSIHDINSIARTFLNTVSANGYMAMNYGSKYYLENIWNINEYPVWLANYTEKTDYAGDYAMWQLGDTGIVDGVKGYVDINVLYDNDLIKE